MAGCIDQVEDVTLTIGGHVLHAGSLELDRDAPLALQLHIVEELLLHVAGGNGAGVLQQAIGQGRFAMVDMRNDAEIADAGDGSVCHRAGVGQACGRPRGLGPGSGSDTILVRGAHAPEFGLRC